MLKIERQNIISRELEKQEYVLVPALSELLGCSEETVRRDLKEMEKDGLLVRTHGGAYREEKYDKSYPMELRRSFLKRTKENFAEKAIHYIKDNDTVMLDSSTTCLALAENIVRTGMSITLITNSLAVFDLVNNSNATINLICPGGAFRKRTASFADPNTVEALKRYHADKCFISCPKVTLDFGLSDNHLSEANVRQQMIRQSGQRFLMADHTKFDVSANIPFEGLERLDYIFTDQRLTEEWERFAESEGIIIKYIEE